MDKSFNDQELSDIMKEIEALEEGFTQAAENVSDASSPVLEELGQMDEQKSVPVGAASEAHVEDPVQETEEAPVEVVSIESKRQVHQHSNSGGQTSMSFKVQGDMNLELQFDVGGKVISLEVTKAGLSIEMEGGVKFSVPVQSQKKAI
jgi:hypothetical protein